MSSNADNGLMYSSFIFPVLKKCDDTRFDISVPRYALYTDAHIELEGEPYDFVDGKIDKSSLNRRELVRLPATAIIELISKGMTVAFPNRTELTRFVDFLLDVLDKIEGYVDKSTEEIYNKIKEALRAIYESKFYTIQEEKQKAIRGLNIVGFGNDYINSNKLGGQSRFTTIDLTEVMIK